MSSVGLAFLFSRTYAIYRAHLRVVVGVAGGVVLVADLILGLGLGQLTARYRPMQPVSQVIIAYAAMLFVTTPLVTAMLARAVLDVLAGTEPSARRAVRCGLDLFAPLLLAIVLYSVAVAAGFILLILPGVYIAVSCYFVAQAVVVDDRRGMAALARSAELVRGRWLRAVLTGLAFVVVVQIPGMLAQLLFDTAAHAADAGAVLVLGDVVVQTFTLPFVAIGATLFYLDLRAEPLQAAARPVP